MWNSRLPFVVTALLFVGLMIFSIAAYPALPERIPQHFDARGNVDRWVATSWASWLMLPVVAGAVAAFVSAIALMLPKDLRYLNLPDKERILALPAPRQAAVRAIIGATMHWIAALVVLLLGAGQIESYVVAVHERHTSSPLIYLVLVFVAIIAALVAAMYVRIKRIAARAD